MKNWFALSGIAVLTAAGTLVSAAPDAKKDAQDIAFVQAAAEGGMTEIKASELALKTATNDEVKKFAQHMIEDHTKASDNLKKDAQDKGIDLPADLDKLHQEKLTMLMKFTGPEFDREYMKAMLGDHIDTIALFKSEIDNGNIHEIKKFASDTMPTLKHHLEMAQQVNKEIGGEPVTAGGKEIGAKDITGK